MAHTNKHRVITNEHRVITNIYGHSEKVKAPELSTSLIFKSYTSKLLLKVKFPACVVTMVVYLRNKNFAKWNISILKANFCKMNF